MICFRGNTPTGVGKTAGCRFHRAGRQKHPHGRGEDGGLGALVALAQETPPRAWGRPKAGTLKSDAAETPPRAWGRRRSPTATQAPVGNTPTGVGKTQDRREYEHALQKHPHGRGEDNPATRLPIHWVETPPRAWGRPVCGVISALVTGNTPTGVGKTLHRPDTSRAGWKHPHGRGEDTWCKCRRKSAIICRDCLPEEVLQRSQRQ